MAGAIRYHSIVDLFTLPPDTPEGIEAHLQQAVYARLRALAADARRGFFGLDTMSTTALVHEAWLRLRPPRGEDHGGSTDPADREQFFRLSATVMRRVLVDALRRKTAAKRNPENAEPGESEAPFDGDLFALDRALDRLGKNNPRLVELVECRFFAGYTQEETAAILGLTERTVRRDWQKARAALRVLMDDDTPLAGN